MLEAETKMNEIIIRDYQCTKKQLHVSLLRSLEIKEDYTILFLMEQRSREKHVISRYF